MKDHVKFRNPVKQVGFAQLEHIMTLDPELSDGAYRTFALYLKYAHQKDVCWPSRERMAADRGKSEGTLKRHNRELQRLGYITRKRRMNQSWLTIIEDVEAIPRLQQLAETELSSRQPVENDPSEGVMDDPSKGSKMTHPRGQKRPVEEESLKDNQGKNTPPREKTSRVSAGSKKVPNVHPAVLAFRDETKYYPPKSWFRDLEKITDLDRWRAVCHAWVGLGRNPRNVARMFDHYRNNEIPSMKGARRAKSTGRSKHHQEATEETKAAFRAHWAEKRRTTGVETLRPGPGPEG